MKNNFVRKHMPTTCKPSVVPSKRRSKQSEATLQEMSEVASEGLFDNQTMCFDGNLQGCLDCVGCSSIEIDCEED